MAYQAPLDAKRSFVFYIIALQLASILIVSGKGAGQIYLDMFLILLAITLITYLLVKLNHGNIKIGIYTIVLLTIGTMLQSIFRQEAVLADPEAWALKNPAASLQVQYLIAFFGAVAAGFFYKKGKFLAKPKVIKVCKPRYFSTSSELLIVSSIRYKMVTTAAAKNPPIRIPRQTFFLLAG